MTFCDATAARHVGRPVELHLRVEATLLEFLLHPIKQSPCQQNKERYTLQI